MYIRSFVPHPRGGGYTAADLAIAFRVLEHSRGGIIELDEAECAWLSQLCANMVGHGETDPIEPGTVVPTEATPWKKLVS